MKKTIRLASCLLALCLPTIGFAHGEANEELIEHYYEHLDDFAEEINSLDAQIDRIVADYGDSADADSAMSELMELWEEVAVHDVIEFRAAMFYPEIWQALVALKTEVSTEDSDIAAVSKAGSSLSRLLWQSYGGLRTSAAALAE